MKNNSLMLATICLALSLALPFLSTAQSVLGLHAGFNWSDAQLTGYTPFSMSSQANYFLGINDRISFKRRWALNTALQYTKRGFFLNLPGEISDRQIGFRLGYVDVSSNIGFDVFQKISVQLGAYAGYRLTEYTNSSEAKNWAKSKSPITDVADFGLQSGIAAQFQNWTVFARFSHSMIDISGIEFTDENGNILKTKIYNKGLQIGIGYRILDL